MTRREARAILAFQGKINRALDVVLGQLNPTDREHAEAYWAGWIRLAAHGMGYASAPIEQAQKVLEPETPYSRQKARQAGYDPVDFKDLF